MKKFVYCALVASAVVAGAAGRAAEPSQSAASTGSISSSTSSIGAAKFAGKVIGIDRKHKTITIQQGQNHSQILHIAEDTAGVNWEQLQEGSQVKGTQKKRGEMNSVVSLEMDK